ncbi:MAG: hypothetical protein JNM84_24400 [Planctomycetes bacterium]|nr:hypothetical protein [Planctomycetota bacterium]
MLSRRTRISRTLVGLGLLLCAASPAAAQIYDSGTVITAPGAGFLGADVSQLENIPLLNLTVFGHNANQGAGFSITDDFTVCGTWAFTDLEFFVYQTNGVGPTIDGVYVRIWDLPPTDTNADTVWPAAGGAFSANLWGGSVDVLHAYRTTFAGVLATTREIHAIKVPAVGALPTGTYWIEVQFTGNTALSGPWVPPISTLGCGKTGNAMQNNAGTYSNLLTGGTYGVGLPFRVYGWVLGGSTASASIYGVGANGLNGVGAWVLGDAAVPVRTPILGSCYPLRLENGVLGQIPHVVLGTQGCGLPIPCGATLLVCPPDLVFTMPAFDAAFESQLCVPIPHGSWLCGACVYLQAFWLDPSLGCGLGHSDGLQLCLGN